MRKIRNPFINLDGYHCFGCSPDHDHGLRMDFFEEGDELICNWQPRPEFEGYPGNLHGGIQATLLDEICAWTVYMQAETGGVTVGLNVEFKKPARTDRGLLQLRARLEKIEKRIATVRASLLDSEGQICSEGYCRYYIYPPEVAAKKLMFPGMQAFSE